MHQQVQEANAALAAAKERTHLAERGAESRLAHFGEMDHGRQNLLADILAKTRTGQKLTMGEIHYGKQHGLNEELFNKQLAGNVDARLRKELELNKDPALVELNKAQGEEKHLLKVRKEAIAEEMKLVAMLQRSLAAGIKAGVKTEEAVGAVEHTQSQRGGYPDPNSEFKTEGKKTRDAWKDLGKEINSQFAQLRDEINKTAQQLKGAHN
jgi:hypothetical protein